MSTFTAEQRWKIAATLLRPQAYIDNDLYTWSSLPRYTKWEFCSLIQGGPKIVSYRTLSIFSLNIYTIFSPVDSVRNLLLIGMHTTPSCYTDW